MHLRTSVQYEQFKYSRCASQYQEFNGSTYTSGKIQQQKMFPI